MKVYIGDYKNSFGTWQLTKLLFSWIIKSEDTLDKIHDFFDSIPFLVKVLLYFDKLRGVNKVQDVVVMIDPWDTYSLDATLAHIISPALKSLRNNMFGYKVLDTEDLPNHLKDHSIEDNIEKGWLWALDEMIFSFDFIKSNDRWTVGIEDSSKVWNRVNNGLRLFGKYYNGLWT
jgi:hypothetical protein